MLILAALVEETGVNVANILRLPAIWEEAQQTNAANYGIGQH